MAGIQAMSAASLAALITAITAMVSAVTGLVIAIQHIRNHDPIPPGKAPDPTAKPSAIRPVDRGPTL